MIVFLQHLLRVLALCAIGAPFGSTAPLLEPRATQPSDDPFYIPPDDYQSTAPGTILRTRTVDVALFSIIPLSVDTHQLLYTTTAINGTLIATVTTVFVPSGAATDRFISFQTAYDSSGSECNPSYTYQQGSNQANLIAAVENIIIQIWLADGYIVASSDYEGPDQAFGAGRLSGTGVLDGIRAVKNYGSTLGFTTDNPQVAATGYSGGAIATGWAASLQPSYAPELDVKAWVAGGTPANLTGTLVYIDHTLWSGFVIASFGGLLKPSAYGETLQPLIDDIATEKAFTAINYTNNHCAIEDLFEYGHTSILSTNFQSLGPELLYNDVITAVMDECSMGVTASETPSAPFLLYHAVPDEIIPYSNASTLYDSWCGSGANIDFITYEAGGHLTTEVLGVTKSVDFIRKAFAGNTTTGCSRSYENTNALDIASLGLNLEPYLIALVQAIAYAGDDDSHLQNDLSVLENTLP